MTRVYYCADPFELTIVDEKIKKFSNEFSQIRKHKFQCEIETDHRS